MGGWIYKYFIIPLFNQGHFVYDRLLQLQCEAALIFLVERVHVIPAFKELAGVVEKGVFAVPVTAGFEGDAVDFGDVGIGGPEDAVLAVGGVDEVAFVNAAAGFGSAGVLQGGVDDDDGAGGQAVDGARAGQVFELKLAKGIVGHDFFLGAGHDEEVAHFAVQAVHVHEYMDHQMRAICLRELCIILMPRHSAFSGQLPSGVDVVMDEFFAFHQIGYAIYNARFRCEQAEFWIRHEHAAFVRFAVDHELIDVGFDAFVEVVVEEAFEYEVSLFVELGDFVGREMVHVSSLANQRISESTNQRISESANRSS